VLHGHKVIEVRSQYIHKGTAASEISNYGTYDLVVCIGDDKTDEDMFGALRDLKDAVTIKVGEQSTCAGYRVLTPYQVHSLLENIVNYPQPFRRGQP
jgi:trehalose 6-phosphate synthase/phosphatase